MKKTKYEIKIGTDWIGVSKASVTPKGWLDYELKKDDGITRGLAQPGKWRIKNAKK